MLDAFIIIGLVLVGLLILALLISYICFCIVFRTSKGAKSDGYDLPVGEGYDLYRESMRRWIDELRATPCREISVKTPDGLTLYGAYYEHTPTSPIEIMFHGYRGSRARDFCVGVERAERVGHSAILVDQRAHGKSDGSVISFGVKERFDVLAWVDFARREFPGRPIILTGISMGAATVMMASEFDLPAEVICTLADCGYTSPKDIICKVMRDMKLPAGAFYPFVRLGALLFGGFDPNSASPVDSLTRAKVPVVFAHGDHDSFVPYEMSVKNHQACISEKKLIIVPTAEHGIAYIVNKDDYVAKLYDFFAPIEARYYANTSDKA